MGFFDFLSGGGGNVVKGTLEGAGSFARDVRAAITGDIDPEKKAQLEQLARELEGQAQQAQLEVNKAEAQHTNVFVSGWRPAIGWTGALALFYQFVARPLMIGFGVAEMPEVEAAALWPIITGMLGLGGMRTYEKQKGVQDKH